MFFVSSTSDKQTCRPHSPLPRWRWPFSCRSAVRKVVCVCPLPILRLLHCKEIRPLFQRESCLRQVLGRIPALILLFQFTKAGLQQESCSVTCLGRIPAGVVGWVCEGKGTGAGNQQESCPWVYFLCTGRRWEERIAAKHKS